MNLSHISISYYAGLLDILICWDYVSNIMYLETVKVYVVIQDQR